MNGLLVANDARDVPPCPVMAVAAPGEEGAMVVVLSEEVDIDQRCDAAGEEKEVFGEAGAKVAGDVFESPDGVRHGHKGIVKWVRLVNMCFCDAVVADKKMMGHRNLFLFPA